MDEHLINIYNLINQFNPQLFNKDEIYQDEIEDTIGQKMNYWDYDQLVYHNDQIKLEKEFIDLQYKDELFEARGIRYVTNLDKIKRAIKERWYLGLFYENESGYQGFRLVEPYLIGRGYKSDGIVSEEHKSDYYLRCFVIKDTAKDDSVRFKRNKSVSESENLPYWRLMRVDRILNLSTIQRRIRWYRDGYTGGSDKNIVERLEWADINSFNGMNKY